MALTTSVADIVARNSNGLLSAHESWERVRLGDVATVQNGDAFKSGYFNADGKGMPLLRIRDVGRTHTESFYDGPYDESYVVEPGDLVIGMDGEFNSCLWAGPKALLNQRVCRIVVDERFLSLRFLSLALPGYLGAINEATPSVTVKHLSSRSIADIPIPLPPRAEQDRIVDSLQGLEDDQQAGIGSLVQARLKLDSLRDSSVHCLFSGESSDLTPATAREMSAAPRPPLGQIASIQYGWTAKASHDRVGPRMLRITDIQDDRVDWSRVPYCAIDDKKAGSYRLGPGDLVFARTGATTGKSYLIGADVPEAVFASYLIRVSADRSKLHPDFLALFFKSADYWAHIRSSSRGIGQPNVNGTILGELRVPVPSLEAQLEVVHVAQKGASLRAELQRGLESLLAATESLSVSMVRDAFAGRLAPQDKSEEPASVLLDRIRDEKLAAKQSGKPRTARRARAGSKS